MDYEEHDEGDEEMGISSSGYVEQLGNSSASLASPAGASSFRTKSGDGMGGSHHHYQVSGGGVGRKGGNTFTNHGGTRYRECLKNHAVGLGGHSLDGCGEFMPAGEEGTLDALKCAACNCHRNFHRKETEGDAAAAAFMHPHSGAAAAFSPYYYRTPAGYLHMTRPQPLALPSTSAGGGAHSRGDDQDDVSNPSSGVGPPHSEPKSKRFRTKFTQEQKDKMLAFAESVGWRIQKQDEAAVLQFCEETAVKRHVLKVWMHNNKHTLGKKP